MKNKAEELSCEVTLFNGARKLKGINKQELGREKYLYRYVKDYMMMMVICNICFGNATAA